MAKSYVGAPPGELAPPPRRNPGSATGLTCEHQTTIPFVTDFPFTVCFETLTHTAEMIFYVEVNEWVGIIK